MSDERRKSVRQPDSATNEVPYPPFFEYLESDRGHELVGRIVAVIESVQKATLEASAEQRKQEMAFHHRTVRLWMWLQAAVFGGIIAGAVLLAWHGRFDATVAALMGTLFGYFLGRPVR